MTALTCWSSFPPLRALIFDMDGTLYRNRELEYRYAESVYPLVAQRRGLTLAQARELFDRTHLKLARRLGRRPSRFYTLSQLGISDLAWAAGPGRSVSPESWLRPNPRLRTTLAALAARFRLGLVTNNHQGNTDATLQRLGVRSLFDEILTLTESRRFKPSSELYREMARRLGTEPAQCLSIGDSFDMDLEPAARIGMPTLLVRRPTDLYRLPQAVRPVWAQRLSLRTAAGRAAVLRRAVKILRTGNLVVVPTDTVYGLAAAPTPESVRWLYRAKDRPESQPLVLLLSDPAAAPRYVTWPAAARALAARHWPGALTLVLPARPGTPWARLTRGQRTVAVRVPEHDWLRSLIRRCGGALPTSSANVSGQTAPTDPDHLDPRLLAFADLVADQGRLIADTPSTVARWTGRKWRILRQGEVNV
jgi:L-threonylcarbamoyladenylate synthase